jgi:hypothetical protein
MNSYSPTKNSNSYSPTKNSNSSRDLIIIKNLNTLIINDCDVSCGSNLVNNDSSELELKNNILPETELKNNKSHGLGLTDDKLIVTNDIPCKLSLTDNKPIVVNNNSQLNEEDDKMLHVILEADKNNTCEKLNIISVFSFFNRMKKNKSLEDKIKNDYLIMIYEYAKTYRSEKDVDIASNFHIICLREQYHYLFKILFLKGEYYSRSIISKLFTLVGKNRLTNKLENDLVSDFSEVNLRVIANKLLIIYLKEYEKVSFVINTAKTQKEKMNYINFLIYVCNLFGLKLLEYEKIIKNIMLTPSEWKSIMFDMCDNGYNDKYVLELLIINVHEWNVESVNLFEVLFYACTTKTDNNSAKFNEINLAIRLITFIYSSNNNPCLKECEKILKTAIENKKYEIAKLLLNDDDILELGKSKKVIRKNNDYEYDEIVDGVC